MSNISVSFVLNLEKNTTFKIHALENRARERKKDKERNRSSTSSLFKRLQRQQLQLSQVEAKCPELHSGLPVGAAA